MTVGLAGKQKLIQSRYRARSAFGRAFRRRHKGGAIVEAATAMALLFPLLLIVILFIIEVSEYFVLKQQLAYVARQAAREIAYAYGNLGYKSMNSGGTSSGVANVSDPNYLTLVNAISVPGVINPNSNAQFYAYFNIPNAPSLSQSYVYVTVRYNNGANLPVFPWNPLKASFAQFDASGLQVRSSCSWPIPH